MSSGPGGAVTLHCPVCGTPIPSVPIYCPGCRKAIGINEAHVVDTTPQPLFTPKHIAVIFVLLLFIAAGLGLFVSRLGATAAKSSAPSPHSQATAAAPAGLQTLGQEYLQAVAAPNAAYQAFVQADAAAESKPCSCPPGSFDASSVKPSLDALIAAYDRWDQAMAVMRSQAPADLRPVIDQMRSGIEGVSADLQAWATGSAVSTGAVDRFTADKDKLDQAATALRAALGLPPPQ